MAGKNLKLFMKSSGFFEYVKNDVLREIPGITSRPMFGGISFYKDGVIFGMIAPMGDEEKLFFKVGESNIKDYEERGMKPFSYQAKNGKTVAMAYYEVAEEILENQEQVREWVQRAVLVSSEART